ncbi:hypothetical protein ACOSQ2_015628 [Xanthoceras sorbifolium]|uniref:OVATE domain-containing protein n=1 Tax=Xanthoceras sorbifolium TaxID=99658 RepID=A0ABQ8I6W5_9ROSI|nr:hypothetical protein JRO89_XS04G0233600 [Xanthoceras sorbifolium]
MLLRNSISSTKKFFHKTLKSFKSLFSGDHYERLPQTPPYNNPYSYNATLGIDNMNIQTSYKDLDRFYTDFTNHWQSDKEKTNKRSSNKKDTMSSSSSPTKQERENLNGSFRTFAKASPAKNHYNNDEIQRRGNHHQYYKIKNVGKRQEDSCSNTGTREERSCLLAEKLRELEMMDMSNVDHLLDIEEVLHYYSRLTCPAYLEIVDRFFMEMYAEFLAPYSSTASSHISSRPKLRSVRS